jgi:hypothetical protein
VPPVGKKRDRLDSVRFHCDECDARFDAAPARVVDAPEDAWHPWHYFAPCDCGAEAHQEARQRHLLKMWASATGPKTAEGIERVTRNLAGHPTPAETMRTRFNAMQHGVAARVATYYPAKPGKYPHCENCEYRKSICAQQVACLKRTELFMKHHIAFETRDPSLLTELNAELQAHVRALISDMIMIVLQDGPRIETPEWYFDIKTGEFHFVTFFEPGSAEMRQVMKLQAHPLLKILGEWLTRNGMSLSDMGMTAKGQDESDTIKGHLAGHTAREETRLEYERRNTEALEALRGMIDRSRESAKRDPVLIEYDRGESHGGGA